jgi:hypothetical protein
MQFSIVNNQRTIPFPKGKGVCEICEAGTLSKCGEKVMWHWAHKSKMECDPWWENETEWHRQWKEEFPESFREIVHKDPISGEVHRADIKSDKGIILEIQNSPISLDELRSREDFYKNLVWIVNAEKFKKRFNIWDAPLPDPSVAGFEDIVFMPSQYEPSCSMFWRKSENPDALHDVRALVTVLSASEIEQEINNNYVGHHSFHWTRPHIAWLEAKCPVLLDFGDDILWRIESYKGQFICVRAISRRKVIHDIKNEENAWNIASKFYPINEAQIKVVGT